MIARLWRCKVRAGHEANYERFAAEVSLPMFRGQAGIVGVLLLRAPEERVALSLWQDERAVASLSSSPSYRETVQRLEDSGMLLDSPSVEEFEVHGRFDDAGVLIPKAGRGAAE